MWPTRLEYEEGDDIILGYELKERSDRGLFVGGLVTLLVPYSLSFLVGGAIALEGNDRDKEEFGPLLIPVAGPFISLGTFNNVDEFDAFILLANGFTQAAGAAMITAGILLPEKYLERVATLPGKPQVFVGAGSASVKLHF
jgi:hypothetical protein